MGVYFRFVPVNHYNRTKLDLLIFDNVFFFFFPRFPPTSVVYTVVAYSTTSGCMHSQRGGNDASGQHQQVALATWIWVLGGKRWRLEDEEKAVFKPWLQRNLVWQNLSFQQAVSRRKWYDHDWILEAEGRSCPKIACNTGYEAIGMAQIRRCLLGEVRKLSFFSKVRSSW